MEGTQDIVVPHIITDVTSAEKDKTENFNAQASETDRKDYFYSMRQDIAEYILVTIRHVSHFMC